jgi:hypothetical protein
MAIKKKKSTEAVLSEIHRQPSRWKISRSGAGCLVAISEVDAAAPGDGLAARDHASGQTRHSSARGGSTARPSLLGAPSRWERQRAIPLKWRPDVDALAHQGDGRAGPTLRTSSRLWASARSPLRGSRLGMNGSRRTVLRSAACVTRTPVHQRCTCNAPDPQCDETQQGEEAVRPARAPGPHPARVTIVPTRKQRVYVVRGFWTQVGSSQGRYLS